MKRLWYLLPLWAVLFAACGNEETLEVPSVVINASDGVVDIPGEGGSFQYACVAVGASSAPTLSARALDGWITDVACADGMLRFRVEANTSRSTRTSAVEVSCADVSGNASSARLVVTQQSLAVYDVEHFLPYASLSDMGKSADGNLNKFLVRISDESEPWVMHKGFQYHTFYVCCPPREDGVILPADGTYTADVMGMEEQSMTFSTVESSHYYFDDAGTINESYLSGQLTLDIQTGTSEGELMITKFTAEAFVTVSDGTSYHVKFITEEE